MFWGAPRIRGELLKLGFAVAQSTVAKYMAGTDGRPSGQTGTHSCATICADGGHGPVRGPDHRL
jgi:hypothetical protein